MENNDQEQPPAPVAMTFSSGWGGAYNIQYALTPPSGPRNHTAPEVAARLRMSLHQLYRLTRAGKIRCLPDRGVGGQLIYNELEIQRYENSKKPLYV